jgi:hypothetical protein
LNVWDELAPVDRVAEGLWQTINGKDEGGLAAHQEWLALRQSRAAARRESAREARNT